MVRNGTSGSSTVPATDPAAKASNRCAATSPRPGGCRAFSGNYITTVPAQQRLGRRWYTGSAEAIHQSLNLVYDEQPEYIVVFGADHVYRMDPAADGEAAHRERGRASRSRGSACRDGGARRSACIAAAADGGADHRVPREARRPARGAGRPGRASPRWATTSSPPMCSSTPCIDAEDGAVHDMGGDIIPRWSRRVARRLRLRPTTTCPARRRATAATGATSGRSTPTTTRTWTSSPSTRSSTSTTSAGRSSPHRRCPGEVRRGRIAHESIVGAGTIVSGAIVRRRCSARTYASGRRRGHRLGPHARRAHRPGRDRAPRDPGQERRRTRRCADRRRHRGRPALLHRRPGGIVALGKGVTAS